jgi:NADH dehydrogenase/NADH:ubiquinone oxidoreductase subunit G
MSIQITIDGQLFQVDKGITVLQAARQNGVFIPTLCDHPKLRSQGSCRMCIVEIQGRPNTPTSCTTPVEEGMIVQSDTPKLQEYRADLLQMLLSEHPSSCLVCPENTHCDECMVTLRKAGVTTGCRSCPKDDQCDLQMLARELNVAETTYPVRYRALKARKNDPFFDRDYNLCILCGRCIRICEDHHFASAITYVKRGTNTVVGTQFGKSLLESGCTFCGACVEICPTGTLTEKTRKWEGVPDRETVTTCPLCSIGCQIQVLSKGNTVIGSLPAHKAGTDELCVKGRFGITELVNHSSRIKYPTHHTAYASTRLIWSEAVEMISEKLSASAPDEIKLVVSAHLSNENLYIANKFARVIGISNFVNSSLHKYPDWESHIQSILSCSQKLDVIEQADTLVCLDINDRYFQSVVEVRLHHAVAKGARLISINANPANPLGSFAEFNLQPDSKNENKWFGELFGLLTLSNREKENIAFQDASNAIRSSNNLVMVVSPDFLYQLSARDLSDVIMQTLEIQKIKLIALPAEGNLAGSLIHSPTTGRENPASPSVIICAGDELPGEIDDHAFVIYHNIYPSLSQREPDLALPATAFTEENGTLTNFTGEIQKCTQVVEAAGESIPTWDLLSRVARAMNKPGFEFRTVEEIQLEMGNTAAIKESSPPQTVSSLASIASSGNVDPHLYMGFPISRWVEGFRDLNHSEMPNMDKQHV